VIIRTRPAKTTADDGNGSAEPPATPTPAYRRTSIDDDPPGDAGLDKDVFDGKFMAIGVAQEKFVVPGNLVVDEPPANTGGKRGRAGTGDSVAKEQTHKNVRYGYPLRSDDESTTASQEEVDEIMDKEEQTQGARFSSKPTHSTTDLGTCLVPAKQRRWNMEDV
jgi:hypothetical protein